MLESALSRVRGSAGNPEFDPDLDTIRDDPRFSKIIADMKRRLGNRSTSAGAAIREEGHTGAFAPVST
jgi:hypothetical protein